MYIDYKHFILLAINVFKYGVAKASEWECDSFHIINDFTFLKAFALAILFLILPFISIKFHVPLSSPPTHVAPASITDTTSSLLKRIEEPYAPLAITLMAAVVVLPRALFWYAYLIIMIAPSCLCTLSRLVDWLHDILVSIPVLHVVLRATAVHWRGAFGTEPDHNEAIEGDLQGVEMPLGYVMEDLEAGKE